MLTTEGLFRKCGSSLRQNELRLYLSEYNNHEPDLSFLSTYSAHDVASLLKAYLADLPEPILEDQNFLMHCRLAGEVYTVVASQ